MVVLVTGAFGQLGTALQLVANNYNTIQFYFANSSEADITDKEGLINLYNKVQPDFCVNAAAYTAVDKAESDQENAYKVNVEGVRNIAEVCNYFNTTLIHISTDFVFDGHKTVPYTEQDVANPQGSYGKTKLQGESEITKNSEKFFIIRTSWLYSQFGHNFMKTMLRIAEEKTTLKVVNDQIGTPTYAVDLAEAIIKIILSGSKNYGTYHFSNEGIASWYDFAKKIFELNKINIDLQAISSSDFPTPAKRPKYSVLDKSKIKSEFDIQINNWEDSLKRITN